MASSGGVRLSRDEYRQNKELEEARKAGTLPAAVDEDGKEINPHIPQYISIAPWYLKKSVPTLTHQRSFLNGKEEDGIDTWYARGVKKGPAATKFRKGACTNCGAMTHKAKDCCDRPRKLGAKFTGKNIKADEVVEDLNLGYDGKHDRWNGYDSTNHIRIMERIF